MENPFDETPAHQFIGVMTAGDALSTGDVLVSDGGNYSLVLQGDGNLVLYKPVWSSRTDGKAVKAAVLQHDGNLALYSSNRDFSSYNLVWSTGAGLNPGAALYLDNESGQLVLIDAQGNIVWKAE